jgi:hypothetical protein
VFVEWRRKPLSEKGDERGGCSHAAAGLGRETIKPVVRHAFRLDGEPRNVVVARPACSVRRCCLADPADPIARGRFWQSARHRAGEARASLAAGGSGMRPLETELWRDRLPWLFGELAKVVPELTHDEQVIYDLFGRPEGHFLSGVELEGYAGRLKAARRRAAAYLRGRRPGESAHAWWCRVEPPPSRVRVSAEDVFARGFGAAGGPPAGALAALGLRWPCSPDEAKSAFKRAAAAAHPDAGGSAEAFRRVTSAYQDVQESLGLA